MSGDHIDREEARQIAERAVEGVLERLGIDTKDPLKAQADFQRLRALRRFMEDEEFQLDLVFIRRWRVNTEKMADTSVQAVVKWLVLVMLGIFALGTKDWWIKHISG